jgi:hypothetical protein
VSTKVWEVQLGMIFSPSGEVTLASWDYQSRDRYIEIRIRRSTLIAFFLSFLIHVVVLFAFHPKHISETTSIASGASKTMSVRIVGLPSKQSLPVPPLASKNNKPEIKPQPKLTSSSVISIDKPANITTLPPALKSPIIPTNQAPTDLMSYIKAKRQRGQILEDNASQENAAAVARERKLSEGELKDAIIKRNLQQQGTNGIFEIRRKTFRTGQFSFKGWKNDYSSSRQELIDVEAGSDGDIDLAIVKKMIAIIRREYSGEFNWKSHRLARVIVLSARKEDNTGLEDFLMQEFFAP